MNRALTGLKITRNALVVSVNSLALSSNSGSEKKQVVGCKGEAKLELICLFEALESR